MFSVYVLYSKSQNQIYIGQTNNISNRLIEHNSGISFHTKKYAPWDLIYIVEYQTRSEAMKLEKELKSHKGRDFIKHILLNGGVRQLPDKSGF